MKITVTPTSGSVFSLADGGDASPEGLKLNGKYEVQIAGYLRAAATVPTPRGNQLNTLTFACTRDHGTYAAAQAFLIQHAASMPAGGKLTITSEAFEGGAASFSAAAAAIEGREGVQDGRTTRHEYTVLCGAFGSTGLGLIPIITLPTGGGPIVPY